MTLCHRGCLVLSIRAVRTARVMANKSDRSIKVWAMEDLSSVVTFQCDIARDHLNLNTQDAGPRVGAKTRLPCNTCRNKEIDAITPQCSAARGIFDHRSDMAHLLTRASPTVIFARAFKVLEFVCIESESSSLGDDKEGRARIYDNLTAFGPPQNPLVNEASNYQPRRH